MESRVHQWHRLLRLISYFTHPSKTVQAKPRSARGSGLFRPCTVLVRSLLGLYSMPSEHPQACVQMTQRTWVVAIKSAIKRSEKDFSLVLVMRKLIMNECQYLPNCEVVGCEAGASQSNSVLLVVSGCTVFRLHVAFCGSAPIIFC